MTGRGRNPYRSGSTANVQVCGRMQSRPTPIATRDSPETILDALDASENGGVDTHPREAIGRGEVFEGFQRLVASASTSCDLKDDVTAYKRGLWPGVNDRAPNIAHVVEQEVPWRVEFNKSLVKAGKLF
ncbi:hypothetical protein ANO11243_037960 [Dothideomycetidae sp. 11243]|nr:hypothetical protein ANO11243_037960 [fungal sp. No.11243]